MTEPPPELGLLFEPDWLLMECVGCLRHPCRHERKWQVRDAEQRERRERIQALTPDDVAWLRANGYDPLAPRDPFESGLR